MSKKKGIVPIPTEGLVLDSSISVAWCFTDEQDESTRKAVTLLIEHPAVYASAAGHSDPGLRSSAIATAPGSSGSRRSR